MTEVLTSQPLTLNHLMCSSSGSLQDLATCSGHSPACIGGPDEPDVYSRQDTQNPPSLPSAMGLQYMTGLQDDVRFGQDSSNSHSPVYPIESSVQSTSSLSTLPFSSYFPPQHHNLSGSTYSSSGSFYYPPNLGPDIKPRLGSINSPGPGTVARSPALPHPTSPITTRDLYNGTTPHFPRRTSEIFSKSPSSSGIVRGAPLSPISSGFTSPVSNMDGSLGPTPCPPMNPTEVIYQLQNSDGSITIKPEIFAKIDKGFFLADGDWTCYRRNYFSLGCSYTLQQIGGPPTLPTGSMYLSYQNGLGPQVHGFCMTIAAVVDGRDGKPIDLVQHTPKRDKGPQDKPARIPLNARPPAPHGMYEGLGASSRGGLYDTGFNQNQNQPPTEATFERIQFKNATANNGKRRAAQQYYHLIVELFADLGSHVPQSERYVKIALRMSAQMVVRGRSPGHYQNERRGSNTSNGPGSSGAGGSGGYTPSGSSSRTSGDITMSGTSSMLSGYGSSYDQRGGHYRSAMASLQMPMEVPMTPEEEKGYDTPSHYYYPGTFLPSMSEYTITKGVKHEYGGQYTLPSLGSGSNYDGFGRSCGVYDRPSETKGYFSSMAHHELTNMT